MRYALRLMVLIVFLKPVLLAQWEWQNPLPQGENLFTIITLSQSRAIVSGNGGTIMTTHDYGENWHIQKLSGVGWVRRYSVVSEDVVYVVGNTQTLYKTTNGGINWKSILVLLDVDYSVYRIQHVEFINDQTGFILLNPPSTWTAEAQAPYPGLMYKTDDGGITWGKKDVDINRKFNQLVFIDSLNGFLLSQPDLDYSYYESTLLHRTSDGGYTWITLPDTGYGMINFINNQTGWAGNFKTTDKGIIWQKKEFNFADSLDNISYIYFSNEQTGYVINGYDIYKTTNEGIKWTKNITIPNNVLEDIQFYNSQYGYICGFGGILFRTNDYGNNWSRCGEGVTSRLYDIKFIDENKGWSVGSDGTILYTNNSGNEWNQSELADELKDTGFYGIDILNNKIYVAGGNYILFSEDGGINWEILLYTDLEGGSFYDVDFFNEETGFAIGKIGKWFTGVIYYTNDGGMSWSREDEGNLPILNKIFFVDEEYGWICGAGLLMSTKDGGLTWYSESFRENLRYIQFTDREHGWISAQDEGAFYRTTNGGINWEFVPWENRAPDNFECFYFFDNNHGVASAVLFSEVYTTTDGGFCWEKLDNLPLSINNIFFINDSLGWAVGNGGRILVHKGNYFNINNIENNPEINKDVEIIHNYPNPFNNSTNITFTLPSQQNVKISIFNMLGENLKEFLITNTIPGINKIQWQPQDLGSGVYLIRITTKGFSQVIKCIFLK